MSKTAVEYVVRMGKKRGDGDYLSGYDHVLGEMRWSPERRFAMRWTDMTGPMLDHAKRIGARAVRVIRRPKLHIPTWNAAVKACAAKCEEYAPPHSPGGATTPMAIRRYAHLECARLIRQMKRRVG